ncbi:MAG: threonine--tRNA ligase [Actinomycetaceae bacterium]|nr:threonine--tRNA ligase [Actinomycetaceae bacterium]
MPSIIVNGQPQDIDEGQSGYDLWKNDRTVVAMSLNGKTVDLVTPLTDGDEIVPITTQSDEGLAILRHSATHVMAQAVQAVNPQVNLGIGPPIENGFYYDFGNIDPITPEDMKQLQAAMKKIVKENQRFVRREISEEDARKELADQPYKLELIGTKGKDEEGQTAEGASVEVSAEDGLTIYDNVRRDGSVAWKDLCRGPHVPSTKYLGNGFALTRTSAAYWLGNQDNDQLIRIYGTAWPTREELKAYQDRLAEAERRDHRKLGTQLDLFSFPDEVGSGLAVFHPNGGVIRMEMEEYSRRRHIEEDYQFVYTPHITKGHLFETSGHLQWYKDGMYPPMHMDEERDGDGNITKQGVDYYLKPMNCPMHNLIYRSQLRSYRDLPLRLFEFGTVYRNEKSGVVHGLARARGFTQDDAHIYCTRDQMKDELTSLLTFVLELLKDYGLNDFYLELSTKDPKKFIGDDEIWEEATKVLQEVAEGSGLDLVPDPGGAAFYGPKISVQARDAIGRTWQMSTIQLDFNLPERFDLEYTDADGQRKRPVMIHRALFGAIERFFAILTEHYAGAFPAWLAPTQVTLIPVAEAFNEYLSEVAQKLKAAGVRARVDTSSDRFGKKIRNATQEKIPFVLIAGGDDVKAGAVSFRYRDSTQKNGVPIDDAVAEIVDAVRSRRNDL